MNEFVFVMEVLIAGLLSGVMYSLVALGFVLIFKASGVFNFAQGAMVLFAALTFARFLEMGINFWLAAAIALVIMMVMAIVIERVMLRPLVAQPVIILFMATIGLNYFLEGMAQAVWDSQVHALELGIEDVPWEWVMDTTGMLVSLFDVWAAVICGVLVLVLAFFFQKGRIGRVAFQEEYLFVTHGGFSLGQVL